MNLLPCRTAVALLRSLASVALIGPVALACGGETTTAPEVEFGETTFVVLVNPAVNDDNQAAMPETGSARSGVSVSVVGGPSGSTDANGIVALSPVTLGSKAVSLSGGGTSGQVTLDIADQDLREVAVALSSGTATEMARVVYAFGGTVVEVTPSMSMQQINDELAKSNQIVFFRSGTYSGDLTFSGSRVTAFGEGHTGGTVTLNGDVIVSGSHNRIRGINVTGNVSVPGSDAGLSFNRFGGSFEMAGSNSVLINNRFCGASSPTISGGGNTMLGNSGLPPLAQTGC